VRCGFSWAGDGLPTRRRGVSNGGLSDSCGALLVGKQSRRERSEEVQVATVVFGHKIRDR
jgi:hypothetical protein